MPTRSLSHPPIDWQRLDMHPIILFFFLRAYIGEGVNHKLELRIAKSVSRWVRDISVHPLAVFVSMSRIGHDCCHASIYEKKKGKLL